MEPDRGLEEPHRSRVFDVDLDLVWTIVSEELPSVKEQLRKIKDTLLPE